MYSFLGLIWALHLAALILPGPDFAVTLRYSIVGGRKEGVTCAIGIAIGVMINACVSFLIGQSLRDNFPIFYQVFVLIGLIYLLYLGISLIKNHFKTHHDDEIALDAKTHPVNRSFTTGILTNVSNVKAIVFFNSILPLVNRLSMSFQITAWIGIGILTAAWFSCVACLLSHNKIRQIFLAKTHLIEIVVGSALIIFALAIFYSEIL